jgi:hypothetical protein
MMKKTKKKKKKNRYFAALHHNRYFVLSARLADDQKNTLFGRNENQRETYELRHPFTDRSSRRVLPQAGS